MENRDLRFSQEAVGEYFERTDRTLVVGCGADGGIHAANRAFRQCAQAPEALRGQPLDRYLRFPDGVPLDLMDIQASGEPWVQVVQAGRQDHLFRCFLFPERGSLLMIGEPLAESEDEVLNRMSRLTNEISNMTRELRRKNRELEAANAEITQLMRTDPLTGLANRRYFNERFEQAASMAARRRQPLSLVMADIDHFKSVNDTYGHDSGDRVLKGFADLMAKTCRTEDLAGRFGGEEFVLLLPGTDAPSAYHASERLRTALAEADLMENGRPITASFGVAQYRDAETLEALIRRADRCLYEAKEGGRNRTVLEQTQNGTP